ncbi:unnamed protein product, partial [marine sediment metagenome]
MNLVKGSPCDFLVVGYDCRFTYEKICAGLDAILRGAKFIVCNRESNFPIEDGHVLP